MCLGPGWPAPEQTNMRNPHAIVDWRYEGKPDLSAGTGATASERAIIWIGAAGLVAWMVADMAASDTAWAPLQWLVALFIAVDVGGGAVANHLNSCKRFYHSPRREDESAIVAIAKNLPLFTAAHVHTLLVYAIWSPTELWAGLLWYVLLLVGALTVHLTPIYLARPGAAIIVGGAIVLNGTTIPAIAHLEWFVPLLFLKIVLGHAVREEPYRPAPGTRKMRLDKEA